MVVRYLIARPSAALFLKHLMVFLVQLCCPCEGVLCLRSCVVLVKMCYVCEVFDNAAFGRVIFKSDLCVIFV